MIVERMAMGEVSYIKISGEIDKFSSIDPLVNALNQSLRYKRVEIDLSEVTFFTSAFVDTLTTFCSTTKFKPSNVLIRNASDTAVEIFSALELTTIFPVMVQSSIENSAYSIIHEQ